MLQANCIGLVQRIAAFDGDLMQLGVHTRSSSSRSSSMFQVLQLTSSRLVRQGLLRPRLLLKELACINFLHCSLQI